MTIVRNTVSPDRVWSNPRIRSRIPELDGVRGLAILLVLGQHYIKDARTGHWPLWVAVPLAPLRLAWSGVDLFFVLSGFLIAGILIDARNADNYYRTFFGRRICRIFPVYFLWLGLFFIGVHFSSLPFAERMINPGVLGTVFSHGLPMWQYPLFLQNIGMSIHRSVGSKWLEATWSLAVEEQFYLLLPFAVRYLSTRHLIRLICASIVIAPLLRMICLYAGTGSMAPYTLLPCRADALAYGALIAVLVRNRRAWDWIVANRSGLYFILGALGMAVGAMTLLPFDNPLFMGPGFSMLAVMYACLLLLVVVNPGRIEVLAFRWKPLMQLGTIAYAVYLLHVGINFLLHGALLHSYPAFDDARSILVTGISLVTVIILATVSWRVLEQPLIRWGHARFRYSLPQHASDGRTAVSQITLDPEFGSAPPEPIDARATTIAAESFHRF